MTSGRFRPRVTLACEICGARGRPKPEVNVLGLDSRTGHAALVVRTRTLRGSRGVKRLHICDRCAVAVERGLS